MSSILNIEIKAPCNNPDKIRKILQSKNAEFKGIDHQIDTYFIVPEGRLKLRQGNIENSLIFYKREERKGIKTSNVELVKLDSKQAQSTKNLLSLSNGIFKIVDKKREIYFIDNVKFHLDKIESLGTFVEIEAINFQGQSKETLTEQCAYYLQLFGIDSTDCIDASYSDLVK